MNGEICIINPQYNGTSPHANYAACYACAETRNNKAYIGIYFPVGYYGFVQIEKVLNQDNSSGLILTRENDIIERVTELPSSGFYQVPVKYIKPTTS